MISNGRSSLNGQSELSVCKRWNIHYFMDYCFGRQAFLACLFAWSGPKATAQKHAEKDAAEGRGVGLLTNQSHVFRTLAGMDYIKDGNVLPGDLVDYSVAPDYSIVDISGILFHKRIHGIFVGDKSKAVAFFLDLGSYPSGLFLGFSFLNVVVDPAKRSLCFIVPDDFVVPFYHCSISFSRSSDVV